MKLISLGEHTIFTNSPYERFGLLYQVSPDFWGEIYHRRYKWLGYTTNDISELLEFKIGKKLHDRTIRRWIKRTDVYLKVKPLLDDGLLQVTPEFFGEDYEFVIREINNYR